ncbi:MAG: RidA family protein [Acidobacteria bacterium]|nr:MAG: RidA family protein [Acidobacteriota bacterium]
MQKEIYKMKMLRRSWTLAIFLTGVVALFLSVPVSLAQEHKAISVSGNKNLPFSDGIVAGNTLYVAGQEGTDEQSKLVAGGIAAETKAALDNIQKVIKAAGFELRDIVSVTVYLADIKEFGDMNKVYREFMPDPKPARATIQAAALVNNARVEIAAIAVKQK